MQILRHSLARFLIVALVGVWSHAAYQDCLAFMAPPASAPADASMSQPCHTADPDGNRDDTDDTRFVDHDCVGACTCGLEAVPVPAPAVSPASQFKPTPDDGNDIVIAAAARSLSSRHTLHAFTYRYVQPAAACLHPLQKYCIQLK